jgi:predicted enzyme related to lactoylglutathione lyase
MQYTSIFVTIATVNFANLVDFYGKLLAQPPSSLIPGVYAEFKTANFQLGIFQPQTTDQTEFAITSKSPLSLCIEVSNLEAAIAHLTILGYPPTQQISLTSHGRETYAYDPDGNRLILHQGK